MKDFATFNPQSGELVRLGAVERDLPDNRFNDGKCDPQGRFWAGTMDAVHWSTAGQLFRFNPDRSMTAMQSQVIFRYAVFAYDFDPASGTIANRRQFFAVDSNGGGFPDGMTVDKEGFVWSNIVGWGQVRRYDPAGSLERTLQLPVPRATDCTFGGPHFKTLYITTARETMTPDQLAAAPLSGSLFACEGDIEGLPAARFAG